MLTGDLAHAQCSGSCFTTQACFSFVAGSTLHQYYRTHEILLSGHSTIVPTCHAAILLKAPLAQAVAVPKQMVLYDSGHNWQLSDAVFLCGV